MPEDDEPTREQRAEALDTRRIERAAELDEKREERALTLALGQERKEAKVDLALDDLRRQGAELKVIVSRQTVELAAATTLLATIKVELDTRDRVNVALVAANAVVGAKKLSRLQNGMLILAGVVSVVATLVAVIQALG